MDEAAIKQIVEPILRSRLADFGFEHVTVRAGEDHDGDPALFLDFYFDAGERLLGGARTLDIAGRVGSALARYDEPRFPHLRWHYIRGEYPVEDEDEDEDDALFFANATPDLP